MIIDNGPFRLAKARAAYGKMIKKPRLDRGYTVKQASELSGVARSQFYSLEAGKTGPPAKATRHKLATLYNFGPPRLHQSEEQISPQGKEKKRQLAADAKTKAKATIAGMTADRLKSTAEYKKRDEKRRKMGLK